MDDELEDFTLVPDPEGFTREEADRIIKDYVCPVCHGQLIPFRMNDLDGKDKYGYPLEAVFCMEHGNVERIGRVRVTSISIQLEEAHCHYDKVIHNLPDLWGSLIEKKKTQDQLLHELGF
jgi:hypothetical protein